MVILIFNLNFPLKNSKKKLKKIEILTGLLISDLLWIPIYTFKVFLSLFKIIFFSYKILTILKKFVINSLIIIGVLLPSIPIPILTDLDIGN